MNVHYFFLEEKFFFKTTHKPDEQARGRQPQQPTPC